VNDDQQAYRHAERQAKDVDEGKHFVPGQVPECYFKIVPDHIIYRFLPCNGCFSG
jgi:hypothetical protein